jgi:hydroxymethylpyrimidine pyrophosphatase-like HAD family hydrolase
MREAGMNPFVRALAVDLDGTLTSCPGGLTLAALQSLRDARARGVGVILLTGRITAELDRDFPGLQDDVDVAVLEGGAVLRHAGGARVLAEPVSGTLIARLREMGVLFRCGQVLLAGRTDDEARVLEAIAELALPLTTVRNGRELMILPLGVDKGTGLRAALDLLDVDPHNTVAAGDGENDLPLLAAAEIGVAVPGADPEVVGAADIVLGPTDRDGVLAVLGGRVLEAPGSMHRSRHDVVIGVRPDGTPATAPGGYANILIDGRPTAGKSHLVGLLVERWAVAGYQCLVIDHEGDHTNLDSTPRITVVSAPALPDPKKLGLLLASRGRSLVLDISGLNQVEQSSYLARVLPAVHALRRSRGRPHWVVVDEAQHLMEAASPEMLHDVRLRGWCFTTYRPQDLIPEVAATIDTELTVESDGSPTVAVRTRGGAQYTFTAAERASAHVRHRHKYATVALPEEEQFRFSDTGTGASTLAEFAALLLGTRPEALEGHLLQEDFSRWLARSLRDQQLADKAALIEQEFRASRQIAMEAARVGLVSALDERYLHHPVAD